MSDVVRVPTKILGVLGGMGPAATAEFLRLLAAESPATKDQEHPVVIVISDGQIPDRSEALSGRGEDPGPRIVWRLETLQRWGVDLLAIPCNTAHAFVGPKNPSLKVPLVHIVDATLFVASERDPKGAWLCATRGTVLSSLYQDHAEVIGYPLFLPDEEEQESITEVIALVKANRREEAKKRMALVALKLWAMRKRPLLLACTELPLAYDGSVLPEGMGISSLRVLARSCVRRLYSRPGEEDLP